MLTIFRVKNSPNFPKDITEIVTKFPNSQITAGTVTQFMYIYAVWA
jgi:hypothetical protein